MRKWLLMLSLCVIGAMALPACTPKPAEDVEATKEEEHAPGEDTPTPGEEDAQDK